MNRATKLSDVPIGFVGCVRPECTSNFKDPDSLVIVLELKSRRGSMDEIWHTRFILHSTGKIERHSFAGSSHLNCSFLRKFVRQV